MNEEIAEVSSYTIDDVCVTCIHSEICDDTFSYSDFYAKCPLVNGDD